MSGCRQQLSVPVNVFYLKLPVAKVAKAEGQKWHLEAGASGHCCLFRKCGGPFSQFSETLRSLELKHKVAPELPGPLARNGLDLLIIDTSEGIESKPAFLSS